MVFGPWRAVPLALLLSKPTGIRTRAEHGSTRVNTGSGRGAGTEVRGTYMTQHLGGVPGATSPQTSTKVL